MRATIHSCFALCAATLAIAAPCVSQRSVEFASFGGIYIPTARAIQVSGYCPGDSRGEVRQRGASVVGARVTAWTSEQLGFDLSLGYSKSGVTGGLVATDESGTVDIVTGSARVLVGLTPRTSPTSFALAAGLARVARGGAAYHSEAGNIGWGPVVGAVGRLRLASAFALRAELDDYVYSFSGTEKVPWVYPLGVVFGTYSSALQNDLVFSMGLSVTALGRGR